MTDRPGYAVLPCSVLDHEELSIFAKMLYAALSSFAGYEVIKPGHKRLAQIVGCSERKIREALDELKAHELVEWKSEATKTGKVSVYRIVHPWIGVRQVMPDLPGVRHEVPDGSGMPVLTGPAPGAGEITKEEITKGKRATSFPDGWKPTPAHAAYAEQHDLRLSFETEQFENHHRAKGTTFKDWNAGFRTWLGNQVRWRSNGNVTPIRKPSRRDTPPAPDRESLPW